jgi:hypothetical protein
VRIRARLASGPWTRELVVHLVKHTRELELITEAGITVHQLTRVVRDLKSGQLLLQGAVGAHLSDLVALADKANRDGES